MKNNVLNIPMRVAAAVFLLILSGCANTPNVREYGEREDLGDGFFIAELEVRLPTDKHQGAYRSLVLCYKNMAIDRVINVESGRVLPCGRYVLLVGLEYGLSFFDAKKNLLCEVPQIPGVILSSKLTSDEKGFIVRYRDANKDEREVTIRIRELEARPDFEIAPLDLQIEEPPDDGSR